MYKYTASSCKLRSQVHPTTGPPNPQLAPLQFLISGCVLAKNAFALRNPLYFWQSVKLSAVGSNGEFVEVGMPVPLLELYIEKQLAIVVGFFPPPFCACVVDNINIVL